ncbi:MAG: hypothetical protein ACKN9T_09415 [Candidatus Methylumidiphilus sp.]
MDEMNASGVGDGASVGDAPQSAAAEPIADAPELELNDVASETPDEVGEGERKAPASKQKNNNSLDTSEDFKRYQAEADRRYEMQRQQHAAELVAIQQGIAQERAMYRQQFDAMLQNVDPETRVAMLQQELQRRDALDAQMLGQQQQQQQVQARISQTIGEVQSLAKELGVEWGKASAVLRNVNPADPYAYQQASKLLAALARGGSVAQQKQLPKLEKAAAQAALVKAGVMKTSSGAGSGGTSLAALEARAKGLEPAARKGDVTAYSQWSNVQDQIAKIKRGK